VTATDVKASAEPLEGNKVKLSVEVGAEEFSRAVDAAFRSLSRQVRIPGFRPGKAPRQVIEKRIGNATAREQAIRDALPDWFARAALDTETDAIAPPEIDITSVDDDGPFLFDAVVEVRPRIQLSGYETIRVTIPSPEVTDEEVLAQIDRIRRSYGTLEEATRPSVEGDQVTIDIRGTHKGEEVAGLTAEDYLYEVGSGSVVPELDRNLSGAKIGDILEFDAAVPGQPDDDPIRLRVLVKKIQELVLPDLTDEWAAEASEFATVDELRTDIRQRLGEVKRVNAVLGLRSQVIDEVASLVTDDPPEAMVRYEMQERLHRLSHRLEAQGATLQQYLASTGKSGEELQTELRQTAAQACKADLALRALAEAEDLHAREDQIAEEIRKAAARDGADPDELRTSLERADRIPEVRSDLTKANAVDWLLEHVEVVDEEGRPVDRSLLEPPDDADPDAELRSEALTDIADDEGAEE
jgi:trigger factor